MEAILVWILISEVWSWHQPILRWSLIKQSRLKKLIYHLFTAIGTLWSPRTLASMISILFVTHAHVWKNTTPFDSREFPWRPRSTRGIRRVRVVRIATVTYFWFIQGIDVLTPSSGPVAKKEMGEKCSSLRTRHFLDVELGRPLIRGRGGMVFTAA
jgi:hypothetical protein